MPYDKDRVHTFRKRSLIGYGGHENAHLPMPPETSIHGVDGLSILHGRTGDALRAVGVRKAELDLDDNLTSKGRREALREHIKKVTNPELNEIRARINERRPHLEAYREKAMVLPTRDKSDLAGALQDREVREYLRSLPTEKRTETAFSGDETITRAILGSPFPAMLGLSDHSFATVKKNALNPQAVEEIETADEAFEALDASLERVEKAIKEVTAEPATPSFPKSA